MAKRPNILKLATKISLESLTYTGITYTDPEYRILDPIVTDDMCRVMMHLRLETDRPWAKSQSAARRAKPSFRSSLTSSLPLVSCAPQGGRRRLLLLSYLGPRHYGGHTLQPRAV